MKFITNEKPTPQLTYKDVATDQFFVLDGRLCQRISSAHAQTITSSDGTPCASINYLQMNDDMLIDRKCPYVNKIEY